MKKIKICCVFSEILGMKTLSQRYRDAFNSMDFVEKIPISIGPDDYRRYPSNRLQKLSCTWEISAVIQKKFQRECPPDYDALFIAGHEAALALRQEVKKHPTILALDVVPTLAHDLIRLTSKNPIARFRSTLADHLTRPMFQKVFRDIDAFLPISRWCATGLINHYAVSKDKVHPLYCPCALALWRPQKREGGPVRLLFVGNDFERKGGPFLLDLYKKHFTARSDVELVIVSSNNNLSPDTLPKRASLYKNIPHDDMPKVFKDSDIFVFPTFKDYLALVASEAACVGLPIIGRDVGGLNEVIVNGVNGYLMPYHSCENDWYEKISFLIDHPEIRMAMGQESRKRAEQKFDQKKFNDQLRVVLTRLTKQMVP